MKRCGAGRRLVVWMLSITLAVQGFIMTPFVYAEEGISQTDDIVSVRTVDKDVLMSVTQNSPYSVKELSEKLDLGTVLPGQSVNVTTTDIDATDLSNWYVYDHYDTAAYVGVGAAGDVQAEAKRAWEEEMGYNQNLRPFYGYSEYIAVSNNSYTMDEVEDMDTSQGNVYHLKEHIAARSEDGNAAMKFYGYSKNAYTDFLFYPANQIGVKNVEYTIDAKDVKTHSLANAGFLFNCGIADGKLSGYAMMFEYERGDSYDADNNFIEDGKVVAKGITAVHLYKLDGVDIDAMHNNTDNIVFSATESSSAIAGITCIGSNKLTELKPTGSPYAYFKGHFDVSDIALEITANSLVATMTEAGEDKGEEPQKVTLFDIQSRDSTNADNYNAAFSSTGYGGFGPIISYQPHGCRYTSTYKYSNLKMSITESESVLCGLSDADFTKDKETASGYQENDKYFILLGDNEEGEEGYKDFFKRDFDDVYLEMLKNQHIILVTNLNIKKPTQGINGTDYNLEEYLGAGNVIQLTGDTPDKLAEEIKQILASSDMQYDKEAADNAKDALDSETGTGHEKAAATLAVRYQGYQVGTVNASRLPDEGITLTLDTEGSIGVSDPIYNVRKPDGTQEQLSGDELVLLPSDTLQSGEYVVTVMFAEGVGASSKFHVSAYHDSYFNDIADASGIESDGLHFITGTVGTNKVVDGTDYEVTLYPDEGYVLPQSLYVKTDEEVSGTVIDSEGVIRNKEGEVVTPASLARDEDYTYDVATGRVVVNKEAITGNLYFYADTSKVTYQLDDGIAVSGEARTACSGYDAEDFSVTLTASGDAKLPKTIRVTIGEQAVSLPESSSVEIAGEMVSYQNGTLTIAKALLKDDIIITATKMQCKVTYELKNLQSSNKQSIITPDADYKTTLIPDEEYELPDQIVVAIDAQETDRYSYDKETGELVIGKDALVGDVLIVAEGKKKKPIEPPKEYSVTYHLTNLTTTGASKASSQTDYVTKLVANSNYRLPADFVITVGDRTLKAGEGYGYNGITGTITIPAAEITGDIEITAIGVVFEQTTQPKPDTSKLVVIPPKYEDSKDGKIIGVTLDMEYSVDNGKTWTKCTSNTIRNLGVGTVKLRFYETDLKKSSPVANIEIESSTSEYYIPTIYMTKKMGLNQKFQLKLMNTKGAAVKYSSSNTKLVTVNKKGVITSRKKAGKAKVVITLIKGKHIVQYVARVTVDKKVKKNYSLAKFKTKYKSPTIALYKNVGKDKNWKIKFTHINNATLKFKSSDESVAVVDKKGKVTGISAGKAVVTVTVNNEGVTDKYYVVIRVTDENVVTDVSYLKVLK